jgi:hypothetical protein
MANEEASILYSVLSRQMRSVINALNCLVREVLHPLTEIKANDSVVIGKVIKNCVTVCVTCREFMVSQK